MSSIAILEKSSRHLVPMVDERGVQSDGLLLEMSLETVDSYEASLHLASGGYPSWSQYRPVQADDAETLACR